MQRSLFHSEQALARQIAHATRPIVFVGDAIPPTEAWAGRVPPIVRLSQVTSLDRDGPQIDGDAVLSAIVFSDDATMPAKQRDPNAENLERIIRRQIKAETKTQLTDDVIVAPYKQEGSIRKAATFLSQSTGQSITKDRVQTALERCGGVSQMASRPIKRACKRQ